MVWTTALALALAAYTQPPSDNELHASYCLGMLEAVKPSSQSDIDYPPIRDALRAADENVVRALERLRAYLIPKVTMWDLEQLQAVVVAKEQGSRDQERGQGDLRGCVKAAFLPF